MKSLKAIIFSLCLMALSLGMLAAPRSAHAQVTGGAATDCTNGCVLYTCNAGTCTVWHCSGQQGCVIVGKFVQIGPRTQARAAVAAGDHSNDVVFAKVCHQGLRCDLIKLSGDVAVNVGSFDDMDAVVKRLRAQGG